MECATAREAISAILDGEDPGARLGEVEAHLAACRACGAWRDAAQVVTRRARLQLVRAVRSPAAGVLAAVQARARVRRWPGLAGAVRVALAGIAAAQLGLTIPYLLFGHDHSAPEHVAHEMGSFGAALAVGFLVAAWRPARAVGMRALLGVAAVLLLVTAVADLAAGRTSPGDEAPHLLAVAGWLLVCYLAAATPPTAAGPRLAASAGLRAWLGAPRGHRLLSVTGGAGPATGLSAGSADQPVAGQPTYPDHQAAACGCAGGHCDCPGCAGTGRAVG